MSRFWYQFKAPFMLFTYFESILKPDDGKYSKKMNKIKTDIKVRPYTEKIKHSCNVLIVCTQHHCLWTCS